MLSDHALAVCRHEWELSHRRSDGDVSNLVAWLDHHQPRYACTNCGAFYIADSPTDIPTSSTLPNGDQRV